MQNKFQSKSPNDIMVLSNFDTRIIKVVQVYHHQEDIRYGISRSIQCSCMSPRLVVFSWKKHPIPRDGWHIYLTQYFFIEIRYLPKEFTVKKLLKNISFSNCGFSSIPDPHSRKKENLSNLRPKEKKFPGTAENIFLRKVDTYLTLQ